MRSPVSSSISPLAFSYNRTVLACHGTTRAIAKNLVDGKPFRSSSNDYDWLGHGIYFWEYGWQRAWEWAEARHGREAAVVGAVVQLGTCLDLLDPRNMEYIRNGYEELLLSCNEQKLAVPLNHPGGRNNLDCAVCNIVYKNLAHGGVIIDTARALFIEPTADGAIKRTLPSGSIFEGGHIQLCVLRREMILAVWSVRRDRTYGR